MRHRSATSATRTPAWSSTSARWRPARARPRRHRGRGADAHPRRTAVTGVGVVAPGGVTRAAFWDLLSAGRTATRRITLLRPRGLPLADRRRVRLRPRRGRADRASRPNASDRYVQFALVAARRRSATPVSTRRGGPGRIGVSPGHRGRRHHPPGGCGGRHDAAGGRLRRVSDRGRTGTSTTRRGRRTCTRHFAPSTPGRRGRARRFGAHGPAQTVSTGCTSGLDAVGYAFQLIEEGRADVVIAGGVATRRSRRSRWPASTRSRRPRRATTTRRTPPGRSTRTRDGFVLGEGAAVLVLEELEHARRRGAHVYCEIGGFATFGNAYHMTGLTREGLEMAEAIDGALRPGPARPRPTSTTSTRTARAPSRTTGTRRPRSSAPGRARLQDADELHQVDGRPLARRDRRDRGRRLRPGPGARRGAADRELRDPRPRVRPGLRAAHRPRAAASTSVLSVGSGFGGFQSAVVLASRARMATDTTATERTRRAVITGIGVVAPNGIGADAFWKATLAGRVGSGPDHPVEGCGHCRCGVAGRGPRLRRRDARRGAAPRPDRPVHPLRDGRRRPRPGRRRPRTRRARRRSPSAWSPPAGSGGGEFGQRETAAAVGPGPRVRRPLPVHRLVLRGQHRPDLHPGRHSRAPAAWSPATRPAAWTPSRTPAGPSARGTARRCVAGAAEAPLAPTRWSASSATPS